MTTEELIKRLKDYCHPDYYEDGTIYLMEKSTASVIASFLMLSKDALDFDDVSFTPEYIEDMSVYDLFWVLRLVNQYLNTPLDKRQPEKKYYVRFLDDNDGTPNYLGLDGGYELYPGKHDVTKFTKQQIEDLGLTGKCWTLEEVDDD